MDNIMDTRELSSLDFSCNEHHDLGLTLSPGSQLQLAVSSPNSQEDELASLFGMDDDFDPFTDFDKLVQQTYETAGSNKRTSDEAFGGDIEISPIKRQSQEEQCNSVATETTTQPLDIHPGIQASIPSIPSQALLSSPQAPTFISTIKGKVTLNSESLSRLAAVEAFTQGKSSSQHISPYAPVGYYPSAPNLHCMIGRGTDSNEVLRSRLDSSRRRLDVVMAERNKYRDALLKYEQVDPETGLLGIRKLETELLKSRRMVSNHRYRVDQLKIEVQEWKDRYTAVATTHNCLIRDYQQLQAITCHPPSAVDAAFTPPQDNHQGSYEQLPQTSNAPNAAYVRPPTDPSGINPSVPSPASPFSTSSPTNNFKTPTPRRVQSAGSDTCSPPALYEDQPTDLLPSHLEDLPTSHHYEDLPPDLLIPLSAQSPPGEPTTMTTNYANSTFSGRGGYLPPNSSDQAACTHQHAGIAYEMPSANVTAATPLATVSALPVPPKDIVVIDLTGDSDTDVSPHGSNTPSPTPLTQDSSPLIEFRRRFRKKKLDWLHESNSSVADSVVTDPICKNLNSRKRKRELGKEFVSTTSGEAYSHVQAQKVLSSGSP